MDGGGRRKRKIRSGDCEKKRRRKEKKRQKQPVRSVDGGYSSVATMTEENRSAARRSGSPVSFLKRQISSFALSPPFLLRKEALLSPKRKARGTCRRRSPRLLLLPPPPPPPPLSNRGGEGGGGESPANRAAIAGQEKGERGRKERIHRSLPLFLGGKRRKARRGGSFL